MPCFFRFVSWMRAKPVMTARTSRSEGHCGVLATATFAVVLVSHNNGPNAFGLVDPRDLSHGEVGFTGQC